MPARKFSEADYDFSGIESPSELESCCIYEFARESKEVIEEVSTERMARASRKEKVGRVTFTSRVKANVQSHILLTISLTKGFPFTPWTKLSDRDRQTFMKFVNTIPYIFRSSQTRTNPPLIFSFHADGESTLNEWIKLHQKHPFNSPENDPIKYGFFRINLKYGKDVLIEEFTQRLRSFEGKPMIEFPPAPKQPSKKSPGRNRIRDLLNGLGVMRLRYHCKSFSEAKNKMAALKGKSHGMFYEHRNSANRACKASSDFFKTMFGWLGSETPIHFIKNWRGGTQ